MIAITRRRSELVASGDLGGPEDPVERRPIGGPLLRGRDPALGVPPPTGGGLAMVSFPFTLVPTADASDAPAPTREPPTAAIPAPNPASEEALAIPAGRELLRPA
jgi:hypothetical protein